VSRAHRRLTAALVLLSFAGCRGQVRQAGTLARYHLDGAPAWQVELPDELREISGLAADGRGRVFAHGDEEATVYELDPRSGRVLKRFGLAPGSAGPDLGKKARADRVAGDFEDLAIAGDRFFLVTSNGILLEFAEGAADSLVPYAVHDTGLGPYCEIEGLAHDAAVGSLLILCKEIRPKAERDRVALYAWSLAARTLEPAPRLSVPYAALARVTGARAFNGSAVAVAPDGRSLVMVAGPQRVYAGVAADGRTVEGGALAHDVLPQPEGLTFLRDGTLLVSSEGGRGAAVLAGYVAR
jgi:hypothetical protein